MFVWYLSLFLIGPVSEILQFPRWMDLAEEAALPSLSEAMNEALQNDLGGQKVVASASCLKR